MSSGGGEVDLEASFGPCPFCLSVSQKLFGWDPLFSTTYNVFKIDAQAGVFPLDRSLCDLTLSVTATTNNGASPIIATETALFQGSASRPPSNGQPGALITDPSDFVWTEPNGPPEDANLFPVTGNQPLIKFQTEGTRTLVLTVTDQFGETGTANVTFTVGAAPIGLVAHVISPSAGTTIFLNNSPTVTLVGTSAGGDAQTQLSWIVIDPSGAPYIAFGPGTVPDSQPLSFDVCTDLPFPCIRGSYTFELVASDHNNQATDSVIVAAQFLL